MHRTRALWEINWYNLDSPLKVGERSVFSFAAPERPESGHDLQFRCTIEMDPEGEYHWATVESIEHPEFGALDEVDTNTAFAYTFRFRDGRWATVEVEQGQGIVRRASPDFAIDRSGPDWESRQIGGKRWDCYFKWDLNVVLSDLTESSFDELRAHWARTAQREAPA
jgi:hypothetical protein